MRRSKENLWGELIMQYLGKECNWCSSKENLQVHHTVPLYAGGKNIMSNVEVVCFKCHCKLHSTWKKYIPIKKKSVLVKCKRCENIVLRKSQLVKGAVCENCKYKEKKEDNKKRNGKH